MPCIERSGALPSVPRRRWPTLTASCGQVQFSDLCAQRRSVAASLRLPTSEGGKGHHHRWLGRGKRRSRSRRFRGRIWLARGLQHLEQRTATTSRPSRCARCSALAGLACARSGPRSLPRRSSPATTNTPPGEATHPTQGVSDHIEALPRQYDTFAAVRFPRIESGNPIL
jgi:hypothetical protein